MLQTNWMKLKKTLYDCNESSAVHPLLATYFGYCLHKSSLRLRHLMNLHMQKLKIQVPHLGILRLLSASKGLSQKNLSQQMSIDKATMVKLIDELEELKLIARSVNPTDRRHNTILLTTAGRRAFQKALKIRENVEKIFFSGLSVKEQKQLKALIPKLLRTTNDL